MPKKIGVVVIVFAGLFIASFTPFHTDHTAQIKSGGRERKIRHEVFSQIVSFRDYVKDTLLVEVSKRNVDTQRVRQAFLRSRLLFKAFEWAAAYFAADLTERACRRMRMAGKPFLRVTMY